MLSYSISLQGILSPLFFSFLNLDPSLHTLLKEGKKGKTYYDPTKPAKVGFAIHFIAIQISVSFFFGQFSYF